MRCLNATGWMHNRLRMIVASFLTKDLHIHWRLGEDYFMSRLIDGDLAANNGGWQWAAGTGADAAPYFRVFNPTIQGQRFDPQGEFIRIWVTELADVPAAYVHEPHDWLRLKGRGLPGAHGGPCRCPGESHRDVPRTGEITWMSRWPALSPSISS